MLLLLLRELQRRRSQASAAVKPSSSIITPDAADVIPEAGETVPLVAFLELLEDAPGNVTRIVLEGDNVVIGRDQEVAQIVFGDKNVSRLHARIKKSGGSYWLYDEGSSSGTQLNFERLGLTPRPLHDEDTIHIGRIPLRFHLKPPSVV
jgi:pSer/pThr/pTyr-binding forkhead associated (FHA) protein